MLSAEGLISMQRVTLDGTKIKANASGNTFRCEEKLEAHLALAQQQVEAMNAQASQEAALHEVQRLQQAKKHDCDKFTRAPRPPTRSACDEEWRRRHGAKLQRATGDRHHAWVGRESYSVTACVLQRHGKER
jgi:hypothetical protein